MSAVVQTLVKMWAAIKWVRAKKTLGRIVGHRNLLLWSCLQQWRRQGRNLGVRVRLSLPLGVGQLLVMSLLHPLVDLEVVTMVAYQGPLGRVTAVARQGLLCQGLLVLGELRLSRKQERKDSG